MRRLVAHAVLAALLTPSAARAQGLAEVARAEAARRRTAPPAVRTYTNDDLKAEPGRPVAAPPAVPEAPSAEPPVPGPATPVGPAGHADAAAQAAESAGPEHDEAYWRARITDARDRLERQRLFAEAMQSRINALTTDFVNRDDPAQRAVIQGERQQALAELTRLEAEIAELTQAITDIREEARRAGVPPGWLR